MIQRIKLVTFEDGTPERINTCSNYIEDLNFTKEARLNIYLSEIKGAEKPKNAEEALYLVQECMTHIENLYSGVVELKDPPIDIKDRMYPAREDNIDRRNDGRIIVRTFGNLIEIESNGNFVIKDRKTNDIWISK